jgi:chloride channel 3/4/5
MALIAVCVDVTQATIAGLKYGYCSSNPFLEKEECCRVAGKEENCEEFVLWATGFYAQFGIYVGWAVLFGVISSTITMFSKTPLPTSSPGKGDHHDHHDHNLPISTEGHTPDAESPKTEKSMYMSAGSGIPEIKVRATCSYW